MLCRVGAQILPSSAAVKSLLVLVLFLGIFREINVLFCADMLTDGGKSLMINA